MPNWCNNTLEISGEKSELLRFKKLVKTKERVLSFDKILPMPPSLNITSGTQTDNGMAIILSRAGDHKMIDEKMAYSVNAKYKTREEFIAVLIKDKRANLEEGQIALDNLKAYGVKDWYDWHIQHWDTKWDTAEPKLSCQGKDYICYTFDTAWSPPSSVIKAMSDQFPKLKFNLEYTLEGENGNFSEEYGGEEDAS